MSGCLLRRSLVAMPSCAALLGLLPAQGQWFAMPAGPQPAAVGSPALAFDAARQVVVLFGGDSTAGLHDATWTWDGATWQQWQPALHPSARTMAGMAYDAARQRVVLFGGFGEAGGVALNKNDTWEWDGANWTERFPAHAPSPRGAVGIAYDSLRQRVVLFGGGLGGVMMPTYDDTWEWDGVEWTQRFPAHAPMAARSLDLAYDSERGVAVLFGGLTTAYQKLNATWEWNGNDWTQRFPAHVPTPRYAAGMAFDSARGRTVLFGGGLDAGPAADTWEFDGQDWLLQTPLGTPSPRDYVALAFDAARARIVMRGGRVADTWQYAGPPVPAAFTAFGAGCAGWAGVPWITANGNRHGSASRSPSSPTTCRPTTRPCCASGCRARTGSAPRCRSTSLRSAHPVARCWPAPTCSTRCSTGPATRRGHGPCRTNRRSRACTSTCRSRRSITATPSGSSSPTPGTRDSA